MKQKTFMYLIASFVLFFQTNTYCSTLGEKGSKYVLANSSDPYYCLAEEIAEQENADIIHEIAEIKNYNVQYLLWVIAPVNLTEKKILEYSKTIYNDNMTIVMGIISGMDITQARELWKKNHRLNQKKKVVLTAEMENNEIPANISVYHDSIREVLPLTKENILTGISDAGYIQVSMHGAARGWFCESTGVIVNSSEIQNLEGAVIESHACKNFVPWIPNSMVNKCIENGAFAYAGFVYAPISGSQLGAYNGLLFSNTWKDFTIGHVVQIQNKAAVRNYAKIPHYFLMGNHKIHLSTQQPYKITKDSLVNSTKRIIQLSNCKAGFLPIKIMEGAEYHHIKLSNGLSHWDNSGFYNRDIEMININKDKYVIVRNEQSELTITLSRKISVADRVQKYTENYLYSKILSRQQDGFYLILSIVFLIIFLILILRKKLSLNSIIYSVITAILFISINLIIDFTLLNKVSVTSKVVHINKINYLGMFFLFLAGSFIYYNSKSIKKKIWAAIVIKAPQLFSILLISILVLVKIIFLANNYSVQKISSVLSVSAIFSIILSVIIYFFVLKYFQKWVQAKSLK